MTDKLPTARETYTAWVKGEVDLDEIDRRVDAYLASKQDQRPTPKKD